MRCYLMRNGHIVAVEVLEGITDDAAAIRMGSENFLDRVRDRADYFDGFEIWERDRMVFRYPDDENAAGPAKGNGSSSSKIVPSKPNKKTAPPRAKPQPFGM